MPKMTINQPSLSLPNALKRLGLSVPAGQQQQLESYLSMLTQWTARINLIAPATVADAAWRHVADSAQLAPYLPASSARVLDVGSGAGLPGLILAILAPQHSFTLTERDQRKAAFLRTAAHELGLSHVRVFASDIKEFPAQSADVITARAYAPLPRLLVTTHHALAPDGVYWLLKGQALDEELTACETAFHLTTAKFPSKVEVSGWLVKLTAPVPRGTPIK